MAVSVNALILGSAALLGVNAVTLAQDPGTPATFSVCASQVEDVTLRSSGDQFLVTVRLTQEASDDWAAFTTAQLARLVHVKVGTALLVEAEVRAPVSSGLIEVARPDRASAEESHAAVRAAPESPCGTEN